VRAYPRSTVLHIVRDARDVVCSLLEKGWLREREGFDDARKPFGVHPRAWVEPERREEFTRAREAARAAWAWRRYVSAARAAAPEHTLEVRYEDIAADPGAAATLIAVRLETDPQPLAEALAAVHGRSVGRWRRDLTAEQVADVEGEAGALLQELGYA
jgi:hypothetical protein